MSWWQPVVDYYKTIGEKFSVNPVVFVSIHIVATPLFILAAGWIVQAYRRKKSILLPAVTAVFVFNAANIYLIVAGKNIPWWVYAFVATTTGVSGYFSFRKIQNRLRH